MRTSLLSLCLLSVFVVGCGSRDFVIESGDYSLSRSAGYQGAAEHDLLVASVLHIDRAAKSVRITYDGGELTGSFAPLEQGAWAEGCPTNLSSAAMEIATLTPATWVLRSVRITAAMLVADCDLEPPTTSVTLLPAPVEHYQPGCDDGGATACLEYQKRPTR